MENGSVLCLHKIAIAFAVSTRLMADSGAAVAEKRVVAGFAAKQIPNAGFVAHREGAVHFKTAGIWRPVVVRACVDDAQLVHRAQCVAPLKREPGQVSHPDHIGRLHAGEELRCCDERANRVFQELLAVCPLALLGVTRNMETLLLSKACFHLMLLFDVIQEDNKGSR